GPVGGPRRPRQQLWCLPPAERRGRRGEMSPVRTPTPPGEPPGCGQALVEIDQLSPSSRDGHRCQRGVAVPSTVRGVIARSKGADVEVVDIVVPDPGPGEAVVRVEACGVCHTDLHYREGGINDEFPFLLGHEAAGSGEAVGEGVTEVAPGDFVILHWRPLG